MTFRIRYSTNLAGEVFGGVVQTLAGIKVSCNPLSSKICSLHAEHEDHCHIPVKRINGLPRRAGGAKTQAVDVLVELLGMGGKPIHQ